MRRELFPTMASSDLHEKSVVNIKKAIFLNPSYWQRSENANSVIASYNHNLPKVGFSFQDIYKGMDASLDRFTQLAGYGLIHIYSHGWAWPKNIHFSEVYLMTGEKASETTSAKYFDEIKNGTIKITETKTNDETWDNVYWISEKFIADHNDFSKDTILFYGGFCYSFLGTWPEIRNTFANGAYFGFSWRVLTSWNCSLARSLIAGLADTTLKPPVDTEEWFIYPTVKKEMWDKDEELFCHLEYTGDATLTLWIDSQIVTNPITNITSTTATGGGNVKSDGGFPITERGVCWSTSQNPTVSDSKTIDGSGTGSFTSNLTGLTVNTIYYVRAYATNSKGTMYGNQVSFTTVENAVYHHLELVAEVPVRICNYNKENILIECYDDDQVTMFPGSSCAQNGNTLTASFSSISDNMTITMTLNTDHTLSYTYFDEQNYINNWSGTFSCSVINLPFVADYFTGVLQYGTDDNYPFFQSYEGRLDFPDGAYTIITLREQHGYSTVVTLSYY